MADDMRKKKRIRAGHKASATRMIREIEDTLAGAPPDQAKLSLLQMTLKEKFETIKALDTQLFELIEEEAALTDEIEQADGYKETVYAALIKVDRAIAAVPLTTPATAAGADPGTQPSKVRLPKLHLHSFGGELTKWPSFWESFESAVHSNKDLSDVEKFNYLTSLLERSAREAISGLALTAANYQEAIATLKKRFGSKQQIVNQHMDALLQVEGVTSSQNLRALRRLFDKISSHVRSLKSLGVETESYGSLLCPVLITKLPPDLQLIISRKVSETDWKFDSLMESVEEELSARERIGASLGRQPTRRNKGRPPPTANTLIAGDSSVAIPCCYCNQLHSPVNCDTVRDVEARKQCLRKSGRCFSCLRKGHLSRECKSTSKCRNCSGRHHTSICHRLQTQGSSGHQVRQSQSWNSGTSLTTSSETPSQATPVGKAPRSTPSSTLDLTAPVFSSTPTSASLYVGSNKAVLLQTALAEAKNPDQPSRSLNLRIVFDSGSQRSYVTRRVKEALALPVSGRECLSIAAFGSQRGEPRQCEIVRVAILTRTGKNQELDLFVVPHICDPLTAQPVSTCSQMYAHLSQINLADAPSQGEPLNVDVLIGSDFYWEFVTGKIIRGQGGPVAVETTIGWVLSGTAGGGGSQCHTSNLITTHALRADGVTVQELNTTMKSFWDLESLGIREASDPVSSQFADTVLLKNDRYEVSLPWREYYEPLPDNYELSYKRLQGLLRRLKQNLPVLHEYDAIIRDQLRKGIVESVEDLDERPNLIHYLPHHAVIRQDKETTKLRVVYDASARSGGPLLNDCLHTGPKFNQKILEILLRFRSYPIGLVADIEKAFLMISIAPCDRDVLRFLWVKDAFSSKPEIIKLRFTRVVFGVSASPFLLNATIKHHLERYQSSHPDLVETLMRSIYVDDVVCGADHEEDALALYSGSKEILSHGSFNLRKFVTNSSFLQSQIAGQESSPTPESTTSPEEPVKIEVAEESYMETTLPTNQGSGPGEQKVLGVRWEVQQDQLIFDLSSVVATAVNFVPTKRNVISLIGKIYDPLGFLAPVTVKLKMLMQELCKDELDWDDSLEGELLGKWHAITADLTRGQPISLPRYYLSGVGDGPKQYRLYGFCDASAAAHAAVVYLVKETDERKSASFVVSKTRVSPLKTQTIPRLELLSALLLARLISNVTEALKMRFTLEDPRCFTDSQVALFWIKGTGRDWKPFVQNRVDEIRKLVFVDCWSHCSGKENPADIPSRGMTPLELSVSKLWRNGPDWLHNAGDPGPLPLEVPPSCSVEMKATHRGVAHSLLTVPSCCPSRVIDCERYSTIHKLFRVTAYVLKFMRMLRGRVQEPELIAQDLEEAERLWILESQSGLEEERNFPMWKAQFGLFKDESQIWRCGGRLQNADLPFSTKHPVLLSKKHYLTSLIVRSAHQRVQHDGVRETLTEVRARYWIVGGRSLVKSLIHKCAVCRRYEGKPFNPPTAPPLPSFRVNQSPPFAHTAVDFAGPVYLKTKESGSNKAWICLFTCCVTHAIHLELVLDMSTATFIRAMKRFSSRRGLPQRMLSDNAKTFKSAAKTIQAILNHQEVKSFLSEVRVEWKFNLEKAPWWGGLFERLVKSTKRILRKMVGQAHFSYDEMHTALVEIEAIINSRPLSYLNPDDTDEPLTPSHLLTGRRILSLPDSVSSQDITDEDFEISDESLQRRAKHLSRVLNQFWRRWSKEYLLELRDKHRQKRASQTSSPAKVGDIVVVHDQDHPRGFWKVAKVERLLTGRDGLVRGAVLKLPSKDNRPTTLQRPLQLLYPLQVSQAEAQPEPQPTSMDHQAQLEVDPVDMVGTSNRLQRASTLRARDRMKEWAVELLEDPC